MDQLGEYPLNGIEGARRKLEPIIAQMVDDERTGADLMRAYFHVYLNVRFIGQSNVLIAAFQDLLEAGCDYRDVHSGMVEAHKALNRSPRWINVLKDLCPDHVMVHDREDADGRKTAWAIVRPPRTFTPLRLKPATEISKTPPEETSEADASISNGSSAQDVLPE
ncbi:hypothetical protein IPH19_04760 [Candidatus Uhrbacteria bacterium]|nr:MAG: hypothetical protein IPH19_04760 [Candidatus Uhrbacteria bacterium]